MTALVILSVIMVLMIGGFLWFYLYSRTPAWGDSETRKALLNMMVVVGPIFGMHYKPQQPEVPTISAPGPDHEPEVPGMVVPPANPE